MPPDMDIKLLSQAVEQNGYCLLHDYCTMQGGGESSSLDAQLRSLDVNRVKQLKKELHHRFGHHVRGLGFMPNVEIDTDENGRISSLVFTPSLLDSSANGAMVVRGVADQPQDVLQQ